MKNDNVFPEPGIPGGATEKTPSVSEYFSWIAHTNEGSNEKQTLAYLDYFRFLHDTYGMKLDIFAWDAGNLDGAGGTYEKLNGEKLSKQYPRGYAPIAEAAGKLGARLGVWCGVDGMGDTEESAEERKELITSLCRDFDFRLFKVDAVCGQLRPERVEDFCDMMRRCRSYCPDLILLNHRLNLGQGAKYATTFLWQGAETYVDIHSCNHVTAPHHRAFIFSRGLTPELQRLTEDHGTCISSFNDNFDDDLIYQAFNRNLILAPEIYGNPWLLRDEEQARLAHLFNLHERLNDILVDGFILPEEIFGVNAVSRGSADHRVLTFGNPAWTSKRVSFVLDRSVGLEEEGRYEIISHHPGTEWLGEYSFGDEVTVTAGAFRAALIEIVRAGKGPDIPHGFPFTVLHEDKDKSGTPDDFLPIEKFPPDPLYLGGSTVCPVPEESKELLDRIFEAADSDSLEMQSLRRAGESAIPEVRAARKAFFTQDTYVLRGCDCAAAFDGDPDTFFDGLSKTAFGSYRIDGGCLRVDFGRDYEADAVEIEYFSVNEDEAVFEVQPQSAPKNIVFSRSGGQRTESADGTVRQLNESETLRYVVDGIHNIKTVSGRRLCVSYPLTAAASGAKAQKIRRFSMDHPLDRIYRISLMKNGKTLPLDTVPRANNLMPPLDCRTAAAANVVRTVIRREDWEEGYYLSAGVCGNHGRDNAFVCAILCDESDPEKRIRCPRDRAPAFRANTWECRTWSPEYNNTFYIPVTEDMLGRPIDVITLLCDKEQTDVKTDLYLTPPYRAL